MNPLVHLGVSLDPDLYRLAVGGIEGLSVMLLLIPVSSLNKLGRSCLTILMTGAVYSHVALEHPLKEAVPASVLLTLLILLGMTSNDEDKEKED